jgi:hypothetical protein
LVRAARVVLSAGFRVDQRPEKSRFINAVAMTG